jgi:hypothetical protein
MIASENAKNGAVGICRRAHCKIEATKNSKRNDKKI